jgi:hypothetical protein
MSGLYGTGRRSFDHGVCRNQNHFEVRYTGHGNIDDDPATKLYLKRSDGSQGFYVPEGTVLGITGLAAILNTTDAYSTNTVEHVQFNALVYRDFSGNVTVVVDPATPQTEVIATIDIVANTTAQCFEVAITHVGTPDVTNIGVSARLQVQCVHEPALARMRAGSNAALAAAEV